MKDLAHHLKKLNRRVIRSAHREEMEEEQWTPETLKPFKPQDIGTTLTPQVTEDWRTRPNKGSSRRYMAMEDIALPPKRAKAPKKPRKQEMRQVRKPKATKTFESQDPFDSQVMAHPQKKMRTGKSPYSKVQTMSELKKQTKRATRKMREERAPSPLTLDEQNQWMKQRTPVFDRLNNAKPKMGARPSKKKTPRI